MFPPMKNAYLQHVISIPPRVLNRSVNEACAKPTVDEDNEPPFLPLLCPRPCIFAPHCDPTRARHAFLRWAIPKLKRELHSGDTETTRRTLASLSDILRDPERDFQAYKVDMVPRLTDLLLSEDSYTRERALFVLGRLSCHGLGGRRVMSAPKLPEYLQVTAQDCHPMVQAQAINTIEILTRIPWVADLMIPLGFLITVRDTINTIKLEACMVVLLEAMFNLVERNPDYGVGLGLLDQMMRTIKTEIGDERIVGQCCRVISQLAISEKGQREIDVKDIHPAIIKLVHDKRPKVHTYATMALQAATCSKRALWRCEQFHNLPYRLVELANYRKNCTVQHYALQALQNLCDHPCIRAELLQKFLCNIEAIQTQHNQVLKRRKERLIKNILWVPYDISSIFDGPAPGEGLSDEEEYQIPKEKDALSDVCHPCDSYGAGLEDIQVIDFCKEANNQIKWNFEEEEHEYKEKEWSDM